MKFRPLKVGDLAKRTGLTVRALHHYDEIGLLRPSMRAASAHRRYSAADVARLQQIVSLRQLGFSLDEVRDCLDRPGFSPAKLVRMHATRLRERIAEQEALAARLDSLGALLGSAEEVSADEFLTIIEGMTTMEKLHTPEQMLRFQEAAKAVGQEEIKAVEEAWASVLADVRANLHLDPASAEAQEMGRRWDEAQARTAKAWSGFPDLWQAIGDNYKKGAFKGHPHAPQSAEFDFMDKVRSARKA